MKKSALVLLMLSVFTLAVRAQNYFDDKWFDTPVKHRITHTNERYRITKIVRNSYWTVFEVMYDDPYCFAGSLYVDYAVSLQDQDTGKMYWLVSSQGIPKKPSRIITHETGPVKKLITLFFPPLPESVKTVTLRGSEMSFYDVAIGNVKPQLSQSARVQESPQYVCKDNALKLDRIIHDEGLTLMYFTYTAPVSDYVNISGSTMLVDPLTGKTYELMKVGGIPQNSEKLYMEKGTSLSFLLGFQAVPSTVKKVNMRKPAATTAGGWDVYGIVL